MRAAIHVGDALTVLRTMPAESVQCCVTSPPYWGLRDYGTGTWQGGTDPACDHKGAPLASDKSTLAGYTSEDVKVRTNCQPFRDVCGKCGARRADAQLGLEATPAAYVDGMVAVFEEVRRVLRPDGVLWLNLGDSYASGERSGLKPKDLVGIPWRVAFALQAAGWWVRSDCIWSKTSCMPESVTDRPTKAHEYVFLLTKSARYFYDAHAVRQELAGELHAPGNKPRQTGGGQDFGDGSELRTWGNPAGRNLRTVWALPTQPFDGAHFATFPKALADRCILAGTSAHGCCSACGAPFERVIERTGGPPRGDHRKNHELRPEHKTAHPTGTLAGAQLSDVYKQHGYATNTTTGWRPTCDCVDAGVVPCTVLDPFAGSGTTGLAAHLLGRAFVGIELNPEYAALARKRIVDDMPLFSRVDVVDSNAEPRPRQGTFAPSTAAAEGEP